MPSPARSNECSSLLASINLVALPPPSPLTNLTCDPRLNSPNALANGTACGAVAALVSDAGKANDKDTPPFLRFLPYFPMTLALLLSYTLLPLSRIA